MHQQFNYSLSENNMVEALFVIFFERGIKLLRHILLERKTSTTREFIVLYKEKGCLIPSQKKTIRNQKWKEENQRRSSSVRRMVAGEKRHSGQHILRLTLNHVSTQRLWNSWEQGRDLMTSSSSILIRHTLQHSSSLPPSCSLGYSKASHFSRTFIFVLFAVF